MRSGAWRPILLGVLMLLPAVGWYAIADPLADCRNLAGQMEANSANNSMASVAVTLSFKAQMESLEKQLAAVTKERDDLRLQLKGTKPDG